MILYQLLMALALGPALVHQFLRGGLAAVADRLGLGPAPRASGPKLWLHAASVGEVTSARWVLEAVLAARPGLQLLVTTNTATARDRVRGWALPGVHAALAPFDSAGAAGRLLDRWQPQALIIVENELWPARIAAADSRGVPVLVIGAKISARSAGRWAMARGLIGQTLQRLNWVSAQDEASLGRLKALGLPEASAGPVLALKAMTTGDNLPPPFTAPAPRDRTLLAASTHEGEEALILAAFLSARAQFDWLILAPRHPRRSAEVAGVLRAAGVAFACRSAGEEPGSAAIYLADTLGEMDHWYAMAGACVIGGTFTDRGGHTPWEPARHSSAILHGPSLHNFAPPFAALDRAGAALAATDSASLGAALRGLDAERQAALAASARAVLAPVGDGSAVINRILDGLRTSATPGI
jgi:3-deoxy-D-manno-octulosonic-acid transferase